MKIAQQIQDQQQHGYEELAAPYLSEVNQQILQRLKQQQADRIKQKQSQGNDLKGNISQSQYSLNQKSLIIPPSEQPKKSQYSTDSKDQSVHNKSNGKNVNGNHNSANNISQEHLNENNKQNNNNESAFAQNFPVEKEHLLVMTIDLGNGNYDILQIYEHVDPVNVAQEFCARNGLTDEAVEVLAKNIQVNKSIVLSERQLSQYHTQQVIKQSQAPLKIEFTQAENYYASNNPLIHQKNQQHFIRNNYYNKQNNSVSNNNNNNNNSNVDGVINEEDQGYSQNQINEMPQKAQSNESIFDRLYNDVNSKNQVQNNITVLQAILKAERMKKKKEQYQQSFSQMSSNGRQIKRVIGNTVLNLGEYLYQKGQAMQNNKKQNAGEYILMQQEIEKSLTFKPEINEHSQQICKAKRNANEDSIEEYLIKKGQMYKERKDQLKSFKENQISDKCKFKPSLNPVSEYLVEARKKEQYEEVPIFHQLYEESKLREIRRNEKEKIEEYTFHPKITRPPKNSGNLPFVERMMQSANEKSKKIQEMRIKQEQDQQEKSDSTFQPSIGRPPHQRNLQGQSVHEYLYKKMIEKKLKSEIKIKEDEIKLQNSHAVSLQNSNQILEKVKFQRIQELFQQLDVDGDGLISSQNVQQSSISDTVRVILTPLIFEIEQNNYFLNFETFFEATLRLIEILNIAQKDELLYNFKEKWNEKKQKYEQHDYQPQINNRSIILAQKRSYDKIEDMYLYGLNKQKEKDYKIAQIRNEEVQEELNECTFKPFLYQPMKIYSFTEKKSLKQNDELFQNEKEDGEYRVARMNNLSQPPLKVQLL